MIFSIYVLIQAHFSWGEHISFFCLSWATYTFCRVLYLPPRNIGDAFSCFSAAMSLQRIFFVL